MQTLKSALRLTLATAAFLALGISAAWAPGSMDDAKLVDEINAELKAQNLSADEAPAKATDYKQTNITWKWG
jgi:hypothetical protein